MTRNSCEDTEQAIRTVCPVDVQELHAQQLEAGQKKQADEGQAEAEVQRLQAQLQRQQRQTEQVCT